MAKDSRCHPINVIGWGTMATENLKDFASEFTLIKGRETYLFFFLFFGLFAATGFRTGVCRSRFDLGYPM